MILVVGGSSRKSGKTTVVCEILRAFPDIRWTVVKLTTHAHDPAVYGDTDRYRDAGAARAILAQDLPALEGDVIIESNRVLDVLAPDLFVFVAGDSEWKPSAERHAMRADVIVSGHATPELVERIRLLRARDPG